MIINGVEHKDVTITGNSNVQNMSMKIDEKAFSILIDKLYSRKKEAIVRELCSNACDAHIDAGIPHIPYDLVLPTLYSTDLVVRDYGKGLSKPDVEYYLGTLFGSKSSESNDAIGGFGLGAKSPFCLVDSYHITSYHEGMKHNFFYVRERGGIPKFVHLNSDVSTEKSGIKFTVNVGEENMRGWVDTTERALGMFAVKPNCNVDLKYPTCEKYYDTVEVIENHGSHGRILACMGGVVYPVDTSLDDIVRIDSFYQRIFSNYKQIILRFDIGEIDVAPSREQLEYKDRTISAINKKILELNNSVLDLEAKITADINSKLQVVPYKQIFSTTPISYFNVVADYSMFSEQELEDYPLIRDSFIDIKKLTFGAVVSAHKFRRIIKTLASKGLGETSKIIINNTSNSYKFVEEHIPSANIVKIPKNVDEKTVLFFLTRVCDYKFGVGNYTIEYFKDYEVLIPKEVKERKTSTGYIMGVRDRYDAKVKKVDIDFEDDTILYMVNERHKGNNGYYYSTGELETLLKHAHEQLDGAHAIQVTPSTEKRLGLDKIENAINIFDFVEETRKDPLFIKDVAVYRAWNKFSRYNNNGSYHYTKNIIRSQSFIAFMEFVTEDTLQLFKDAIIDVKTYIMDKTIPNGDMISPLEYMKNEGGFSYNDEYNSVMQALLADVLVPKAQVLEKIKADVNKMTLQEVLDTL